MAKKEKISLTEATMLALQGKLKVEETYSEKPVESKIADEAGKLVKEPAKETKLDTTPEINKKTEAIEVADDNVNVTITDTETIIGTEDATVVVSPKEGVVNELPAAELPLEVNPEVPIDEPLIDEIAPEEVEAVPDAIEEIPIDAAVIAIGNGSNPIISRTTPDLEVNKWGNIIVDEATMKTNKQGVFAGGDIVTGGATVILAMGAGRVAAKAIDEYLMAKWEKKIYDCKSN